MEPVTITAATIATLAFTKFLESSVGKLSEKFTETAITKMNQLRQLIWQKLRGNPRAETALAAVEQGSKPDLDRLTVYLQDAMEDDPQFATEVKTIAQEIHAGKLQDHSRMTQVNQDNAKGWQTKVEGGTAYIGEIHITQHQP
ncbi:MAG: hypothetical protein HC827_22540 [Cyanobacteria bacterium RM1_2_2]|nr:hypothetical protein [Cyanobacteria bacterium RM1_2_2]